MHSPVASCRRCGCWLGGHGAALANARRQADGTWLCSKCRSKGKPAARARSDGGAAPWSLARDATASNAAAAQPLLTAAPSTVATAAARSAPSLVEAPPAKRRGAASSAAAAAATSSSIPAFPLSTVESAPAPLLTRPDRCFRTHGFVLQPADERTTELAREIEQAKPKDANYTIAIAGNVAQLDVLASQHPGGLTSQQLARIIALAIDATHHHTHIPSAQLQVRAIKLLTARAGEGEQLIHFDHHNGFLTVGRFSFLLYITEGTQSTAMWRHPLALLPQNDSSAAMKEAYARLFDKQQYHTVPVHQGQSMLFDERAPHFGSKTRKLRRVLFVQLADTEQAEDTHGDEAEEKEDSVTAMEEATAENVQSDAYQYYEWQYVGEAWGWHSREYAESLVRNKEHRALHRFARDDLRQAINLLREFGLFHAYFGRDEEPQWLQDALKD